MSLIIIIITVLASMAAFQNHSFYEKALFRPYLMKNNNEWWRWVSNGFIHADYTHLIVNMLSFYFFASYVENEFNIITGNESGILFVVAGYVFSDVWTIFASLIFIAALLSLMLIDLDTFLLPDELTLPLLWLGLLFNLQGLFSASLTNAVIGAVVGYLSLWSLYWIFKLLTKREGMGYGDFKLLAALGAWLGWQNLVSVLLVSSCLGILYALVLRFSGRLDRGNPIPFGPFLGGAGIVTLLFAAHLFPILIY